MHWCFVCKLVLTISLWTSTDFVRSFADESANGKSGVINFSTPNLNDEEAHSQHMPVGLKCDGCLVVAYQLSLAFNKAEARKPSKRLTESEIVDVVDSVCSEGFEQYGVKEFKGKKHLSGPGMQANEAPGIMQGGGKWPTRLQAMCSNYVGDLGEDDLYDAYRKDKRLVDTLCHGKGIFGNCIDNDKDEL